MRRSSHKGQIFFLLVILAVGGIGYFIKNFDVPVEQVEKEIPYSQLQKK